MPLIISNTNNGTSNINVEKYSFIEYTKQVHHSTTCRVLVCFRELKPTLTMTATLLIPLRRVYQIPGDKETETKTRDIRLHMMCILNVARFTGTKYCCVTLNVIS